jgi:hypothetical protein
LLCISRSMSSFLNPVFSSADSFCAVIHVLRDCSLCNLQVAVSAGCDTL